VGRIGRPHGLRGEVTVVPDSVDHFVPGSLLEAASGRVLTVKAARPYRDKGLIVAFEGISDRTAADLLRGETLTIDAAERRDLEEGEYWADDLIGLEVVDPSGNPVGIITGVVFGPQDRLVVGFGDQTQIEVPFAADLVGEPESGSIVIDIPVGLERRTVPGSPSTPEE
jgi:16S rRNA processing protein RimM